MEKKTYILCPRCELNYMDSREKYCDVCKAELGIGEANFLLPDEEDESEGKLCPICHTNYCEEGEDMCIECKKERASKDKDEEETDWVKLVTSIRGNSMEGRISIESPLGKAILGHKAGDRVHVMVGDGGYDVVIRSIEKDAGDEDEIRKF